MKSAYELAMERLNRQSPTVTLSADQKRRLAELDSLYAAKIAEKELQAREEATQATAAGETETAETIQRRLVSDRKSLHAELEEKKDLIRHEQPSTRTRKS